MVTHRVLVIGYGSPIRGDDAIGPLVIERLEREGMPEGTNTLARHILTPDLVPEIAAAELVVFVDAAVEGAPGEVQCRRLAPAPGPRVTVAHFLDPQELLAWTATLCGRRPEAYLVSTPGLCFEFRHLELSDVVAATIDDLVGAVRALIEQADPCDQGRNARGNLDEAQG